MTQRSTTQPQPKDGGSSVSPLSDSLKTSPTSGVYLKYRLILLDEDTIIFRVLEMHPNMLDKNFHCGNWKILAHNTPGIHVKKREIYLWGAIRKWRRWARVEVLDELEREQAPAIFRQIHNALCDAVRQAGGRGEWKEVSWGLYEIR